MHYAGSFTPRWWTVLATYLLVWSIAAQTMQDRQERMLVEEAQIRAYTADRMGSLDPALLRNTWDAQDGHEHELTPFEEAAALAEMERHYWRLRYFEEHPTARLAYHARGGGSSCVNGDFEAGVDGWDGASGTWTAAQCSGLATNSAYAEMMLTGNPTHFELMSAGLDPITGVQQVHGGDHSMRINWVRRPEDCTPSWWVDKVSQRIALSTTSQQIGFYFACVYEDPSGHTNNKPYFSVRALGPDSTVLDYFCSAPDLLSDFLQTATAAPDSLDDCPLDEQIRFVDWNCNILNVSGAIGDSITLEFVAADCGKGGHFGYAYLDDVCSECLDPLTGLVQLSPAQFCGAAPAQVCGTYIPANADGGDATVEDIRLYILENDLPVGIGSPVLVAHDPVAHTFCFEVDPANLPAGSGFDLRVEIDFSTNNTEYDVNTTPGLNNDLVFTGICCPVMVPELVSCYPVSGVEIGNALLDWTDVPGALGYEIELSTYTAGCCTGADGTPEVFIVPTINSTSFHILEGSNLYPCATWRVRAQCAEGEWGEWSEAQCLCNDNTCVTTAPTALTCIHNASPGAGGNLELSWQPYTLSSQFEIQITTFSQSCCAGTGGFAQTFNFVSDTAFLSVPNAGHYPCARWRVRERCYDQFWSPFSAPVCLCAPAYCATTAPTGTSCVNENNNLTLSWAFVPYADQYEVRIRTHTCPGCTPTGTSVQYTYTTNVNHISSLDQLLPASMYPCAQWTVRARCTSGTWSSGTPAACICGNTSNCTSLITNGTFQTSSSSGPIAACTTGVPQNWQPYQLGFTVNDSKIYAPLRGVPGAGGLTAFPNNSNPESYDALPQNQRYMGFLDAHSAGGINSVGRSGVTQTLSPTVVNGGNYFLRFRYAFYRATGTGTATFQVRAMLGTNPGCTPTVGTTVFTQNVNVGNNLAGLTWVTRTVPFTAAAAANALSVEAKAVSVPSGTKVMFYIDGVELVRYPCRQDLNGNGIINDQDLLLLMGYFGLNVNAINNLCHAGADVNADGVVNGTDVALFNTMFGTLCNGSGMVEQDALKSLAPSTAQPVLVVPNPNTGLFTLQLPGLAANLPITIVAADGREVLSLFTTGEARLDIDLTAEPAGLYTIRISDGERNEVLRVVKE